MTPFTVNLHGNLLVYDRPVVMGICNITPDSFYAASRMDEGRLRVEVQKMIEDGADIIDLGGYSSRPGATEVPEEEEIRRISQGMNVIRQISTTIPVSIDTFRSSVAEIAIKNLGADIINDISGGDGDKRMFATVAGLQVPYVLMHMRGTPATMQQLTDYQDVTADVIKELAHKVRELSLLGVSNVIIDPGFGFAKTLDQNYALMRNLPYLQEAFPGYPLLVGISRKSMLTRLLDIAADEALEATVALNSYALMLGASILRVHDVKAARQQVVVYEKLMMQ